MSAELLERYRGLQAYVDWNDDDAARIKGMAHIIEAHMNALIDDFYAALYRARSIGEGLAMLRRDQPREFVLVGIE